VDNASLYVQLVKLRATAGVRPYRMISTTVVRVEALAIKMKHVQVVNVLLRNKE